jgi:hypothetical protein
MTARLARVATARPDREVCTMVLCRRGRPSVASEWSMTIDCEQPAALARFWSLALGYVEQPAPAGFATWREWMVNNDVPENEWGDVAYLADPAGTLPSLSFLRVPERKVAKNRVHIDVKVSGGRASPPAERESRIRAEARRLTAAGASVVSEHLLGGGLDHLVLTDPEGNEFCIV